MEGRCAFVRIQPARADLAGIACWAESKTEGGTATMTTRPIRVFSRRNRTERARRYAADVAPTIKGIQEAGITSLEGIAAELTRLGIAVAAGSSEWRPAQVAWVLHQLRWRRAAVQANRHGRTGHVPTPGIGIVGADEAVATRLLVEGVVILRTVPGSPAALAGLRGVDPNSRTLGDVIVGANDQAVQSMSDLTDQLEQVGVGQPIKLTLLRDGRKITVSIPVTDIGHTP
jgi:S1-C subfamily serine protease